MAKNGGAESKRQGRLKNFRWNPGLSSVTHSLLHLVAGTTLGQVITIVAAPVLTRLYTPDEFGVFAVFSAIINAMGPVATLRYERAIPLPKEESDSRAVLILCIVLALLVATALGVVLWMASVGWVQLPFLSSVASFWWLIAVGVAGFGIYQALSQWNIRNKTFSVLARTKVQQGVASVTTQLVSGIAGIGPIGLMVGQVIGHSAGIRVLARSVWQTGRPAGRSLEVRRLLEVAKRYVRFPLMSMPSAFFSSLTLTLPNFMLATYYDAVSVGLYSLTVRVAGIPMTMVGTAVSNVYLGEVADLLRTRPDTFRQFYYSSLKKISLAGVVGVGLPLSLARYVMPIVFGEEWTLSGYFLQLLAPMYVMQFIAVPFGSTLAVLERQDLLLVSEMSCLALIGIVLWLGPTSGLTVERTIAGFGLAGFLGYCLLLFVSRAAVERWYMTHG